MTCIRTALAPAALVATIVSVGPGCQQVAPPPGPLPAAPRPVAAEKPAASPASKVALLVAINRYDRPEADGTFEDLHGCVRDAERLRGILVSRFGFEPENVVLLEDEAATHAGIVRAFHDVLLARSGPQTEALFFYAGHGSRLPDLSGRQAEYGDTDWSLVAYDARQEGDDAPFDLIDDELHSLLCALTARTSRVTVFTDACHSADATRGSRRGVRSAPPGRRGLDPALLAGFWPPDVPLLEDGDPRRRDRPVVHMAACGPDQKATEYDFDDADDREEIGGLFTFLLCGELERMPAGTTYAQLARRVAAQMATTLGTGEQEPTLAGPGERRVLSGDFGPALRGLAAGLEGDGSPRVLIQGGRLHGLVEGTILAIETIERAQVGLVRLARPMLYRSVATWLDRPPLGVAPRTALRALPVELPDGEPDLVVRLPASGLGELCRELAASRRPRLRVVHGRDELADYELVRIGDRLHCTAGDLLLGQWDIGQPDAASRATPALLGLFANEVRYRALMRLTEADGNLRPTVEIEAPPPEEVGLIDARAQPALLQDKGSAVHAMDRPDPVMDVARLRIRLPGRALDGEYYVTILSVTEDRAVTPILPLRGQGDRANRFPAGSTISGDVTMVHLFVPPTWRLDRPMLDRYLVLVTRQAIEVGSLEGEGSLVEKASALHERLSAVTRGGEATLPGILERALTGTTRGGSGRGDDFGIATLDVRVERTH